MPPMELQRRHSVNRGHGAQGGVCKLGRGSWDPVVDPRRGARRLEAEERATVVVATVAEGREQVVYGVVELGDGERGAEATVRLGSAPELGNPAGDGDVELSFDLVSRQLGRALVARAHHRQPDRADVAAVPRGLEQL